MPCQDCAGTRVELFSLRDFMSQWFNILIEKIDTVEQQNTKIVERLDQLETKTSGAHRTNNKLGSKNSNNLRHSPSSSSSGQSHQFEDPARLFNRTTTTSNNPPAEEALEEKPLPTLTFGPGTTGGAESAITLDDEALEPLNVTSGMDDDSLADLDMSKFGTEGLAIDDDVQESDEQQPNTSAAAAVRSAITNAAIGRTELGRFTCRLCDSTFTQLSNLRRHVRVIHQGASKHACRYCGKMFAWKGAWRRHEQFVHELRSGYKSNLPTTVNKAIHFKPFD